MVKNSSTNNFFNNMTVEKDGNFNTNPNPNPGSTNTNTNMNTHNNPVNQNTQSQANVNETKYKISKKEYMDNIENGKKKDSLKNLANLKKEVKYYFFLLKIHK